MISAQKAIFIPLFMLVILAMIPSIVEGFEIRSHTNGVIITEVWGYHFIEESGKLSSTVYVMIGAEKDVSRPITIYISPPPFEGGAYIEKKDIEVCVQDMKRRPSASNPQLVMQCEKKIEVNESKTEFTFQPKPDGSYQDYFIRFNYTYDNFIFQQGDYQVANINFLNPGDDETKLFHKVYLPSSDDILRFIPKADYMSYSTRYDTEEKVWTLIFRDTDKKVIWYWNESKLRERHIVYSIVWTFMGAEIGRAHV